MSFFKAARSRITYANVTATLALVVALTTGTAYAAATITSADIVNGTIAQADVAANSLGTRVIKDGGVKTQDLRDGAVTSADVLDQSIDDVDLATDSVTGDETAPSSVGTEEIATNGVGSAEVIDFGLSNQDIGVLFAQVAADGTVDNSSGGVSSTRLGAGQYAVDFDRNISSCAFQATIGPSGAGSALGSINVADRAVSVEAVFVGTHDALTGALADRPFHLVVVC